MPFTGLSLKQFIGLFIVFLIVKYAVDMAATIIAQKWSNPFTLALKAVAHA